MAAAPHAPELEHAAEPASGAFPPFDPTLFASQLIWFALSFGALYFVVSRFVLPGVQSVLDRRAGQLARDREGAAAKTAAAEAARAAMEQAVAKARADARKLIEAMRAEVQAKLNWEQAQAEAKLAQRAAEAETKINAARDRALGEIPALAASLGRDIADRIAPRMAEGQAR